MESDQTSAVSVDKISAVLMGKRPTVYVDKNSAVSLGEATYRGDWFRLAQILDRCFFIIYLIANIIMALIIFTEWN